VNHTRTGKHAYTYHVPAPLPHRVAENSPLTPLVHNAFGMRSPSTDSLFAPLFFSCHSVRHHTLSQKDSLFVPNHVMMRRIHRLPGKSGSIMSNSCSCQLLPHSGCVSCSAVFALNTRPIHSIQFYSGYALNKIESHPFSVLTLFDLQREGVCGPIPEPG
jgi:hypothetical protein